MKAQKKPYILDSKVKTIEEAMTRLRALQAAGYTARIWDRKGGYTVKYR